jgi:hypothetical protein
VVKTQVLSPVRANLVIRSSVAPDPGVASPSQTTPAEAEKEMLERAVPTNAPRGTGKSPASNPPEPSAIRGWGGRRLLAVLRRDRAFWAAPAEAGVHIRIPARVSSSKPALGGRPDLSEEGQRCAGC